MRHAGQLASVPVVVERSTYHIFFLVFIAEVNSICACVFGESSMSWLKDPLPSAGRCDVQHTTHVRVVIGT